MGEKLKMGRRCQIRSVWLSLKILFYKGELLNISHDNVNRFLNRESYTPKDMFNEAKSTLNLIGGVLSVDDSVLDKPYSNYIGYVGYYYSGKHHAVVKGINLITLLEQKNCFNNTDKSTLNAN